MDIEELYGYLKTLMEEGKGHYRVLIETLDGCVEGTYGIDIEDNSTDVVIKGC